MEHHTIHLFINNHPPHPACSLAHRWVPLVHNGGAVWPMTQARLCCSGSEGTDEGRYQAGPGSPRWGWNGEQNPQLRFGDVMFCAGAQCGMCGTGPPLYACPTPTQARDASGAVQHLPNSHPACPKPCANPAQDSDSPQRQMQPTGPLLL